jgi:drug/metabolite transporter (DMT)-like permease
MNGHSPDRLTLAAFALFTLIGGSNAVAVRFSNVELPPFWGAAIRFGAASLLLFVAVLIMRLPLPRGRAFLGVAIYGVLSFAAFYAFVYWGLVEVKAGLTMVILSLVPLMTLFLAFAHGQEPFRWRGLLGAVIAVGGITLAFVDQIGAVASLLPMLAIVAGAAFGAEGGVVAKGFPKSHPVTTNAVAMSVGAIILLAVSIVAGERWGLPNEPATWTALVYLVLPGSIGLFVLFLFVLARWTASATSYSTVLMPFVTVVVAALLLGESVTPLFVLGGVLVLVGVWVGALAPQTSEPSAARPLPEPVAHSPEP